MANGKEYELKVRIGGEVNSSFGRAFSKAEGELAALYKFSDRTNQSFLKNVDRLDSFANKTFSVMAKGAAAASAGLAGVLTASTMVGKSFESQMSTVQAISQASSDDMRQLKAVATEMGRTTKFSAAEAGQGLEYMAMAGWKTREMVSGLPGIMYLAAASGEELGTVSDIVTDAMTAFNLQADQSAHFADVLAQASSSSNTNVAMMGATFQYVAPVAGSFGYTIEDVAVATGLMANAGIKGEKSGTAMRTMLTNLAKPTKEMQRYMSELSISLVDGAGKMKPFRQQIQELRQGFAGLTEAERAEYAAGIAGKEGMSGLLAVVNASEADFTKLTEAIDHSTGAAKRMSEIRLDNLEGDTTILKSGLEGAGIEIYGGFNDLLRQGAQDATAWISTFTENLEEDIPTIRREAGNFARAAEDLFGPLMDAGKWFLQHPAVISGGIKGTAAALLTFKAAKGATAAVKLFGTLSGMVSAWPVAAAGLVIGGIVGIGSAMEQTAKRKAAQNLAEHFGDVTLSLEELNEAARHIVGAPLFDQIEAMEISAGKARDLYQSMEDSLKSMRKTEWKLSMGIELSADDAQSYVESVDSYVNDAQSYITEKGYELSLAVKLVFGDSDQSFSEDSGAFYQSLLAQLDPLQDDISAALQDITENGLTLDKQKIVDDYLAQMADITGMITDAQNAAKLQMIEGQFSGAALTPESFQNLQASIADYTEQANTAADEAYQTILTSLNAQRIAGEKGMEGGIDQTVFEDQSAEATAQYYQRKAETILNGYRVMEDTIMATYGDEIQPALDAINQSLSDSVTEIFENPNISDPQDFVNQLNFAIDEALSSVSLSQEAKGALGMLLEGMAPTEQQLSDLTTQIQQAGQEIPKTLKDAMAGMGTIGAAAGEKEDLWAIIGNQIVNSPERALLLETVQQQSGQIPQEAVNAVESMYPEAEEAARGFLEAMRKQFNEGLEVTVPVNVQTLMKSDQGQTALRQFKKGALPAHADGGIFDTPHIAEFAEDGPEAAIPLDGSRRAADLWKETGRLLGLYQENNYGAYSKALSGVRTASAGTQGQMSALPAYAPVFNLYGSAGREEVEEAGQASFEQFKEWFLRFEEGRSRMSF